MNKNPIWQRHEGDRNPTLMQWTGKGWRRVRAERGSGLDAGACVAIVALAFVVFALLAVFGD